MTLTLYWSDNETSHSDAVYVDENSVEGLRKGRLAVERLLLRYDHRIEDAEWRLGLRMAPPLTLQEEAMTCEEVPF